MAQEREDTISETADHPGKTSGSAIADDGPTPPDAPAAGGATSEEKKRGEEGVERANNRKKFIGLGLGLLLAVVVFLVFPSNGAELVNEGLDAPEPGDDPVSYDIESMRLTASVAVLMAAWWMTGALPLAATALVPMVIFPIAQVAEFSDISPSYANATIMLFLGGFLIALGIQRWGLHRRLALVIIRAIGTKPKQIILGFMIATAFLSMWVSNTATAVVMLPIGISVLTLTADRVGGMKKQKNFATALMLAIAYSASIGALGTLIGTPPNAMMAAYMADNFDIQISFVQWMAVGTPTSIVFIGIAWFILTRIFRPEVDEIPGGRELIDDELRKLGPIGREEVTAGIIFATAAVCWIAVPLVINGFGFGVMYDDAIIGITAAVLMFIVPVNKRGTRVLDWETAKGVPWDVLILFGGGLALSAMITRSGLSLWIGEMAGGLTVLPIVVLVFAVAVIILVLTEFTSNTATAATFIPVMGGVGLGMGLAATDPINILFLIVPVTFASTCAFMLPVATPPNAIAYGSGYVTAGQMLKGGLWLNVVAVFLITLAVFALAVPVFGLTFG